MAISSILSKRKPPVPTDTESRLAQLGTLVAELRARDAALVSQQITQEKRGARRPDESPAPNARALALVSQVVPLRATKASVRLLDQIDTERRDIAAALAMADVERAHLLDERRLELVREFLAPWRAIMRRRAVAVVQLQAAERDLASIRARFAKCGQPRWPADGHALLGDGSGNAGPAYEFLQALVADGTVTKAELAQIAKEGSR